MPRAAWSAREKIARSERMLRDALDSMPDGVALFDAEDRLVMFNERYRRMNEVVADLIVAGSVVAPIGIWRSPP